MYQGQAVPQGYQSEEGRDLELAEVWMPVGLKVQGRTVLRLKHVCFGGIVLETRQQGRYQDWAFGCPMAWKTSLMASEVEEKVGKDQ